MTGERFEALVNRLEQQAKSNPGRYKLRVLLLAMLGNAYVGAMLLLLVALLAALIASVTLLKVVAVKLIVVVGLFLWTILKALWVTIDPPEGTEVKAGQAPELFTTINGLRHELRAPRFHHVLFWSLFGYRVTGCFQLHNKQRAREVLRQIQQSVRFPGETLIINVEGRNRRFGRKFRWMRGARVL